MGENDLVFKELDNQKPTLLLNVCHNNMDSAYGIWLKFLTAIEEKANAIDYDIKGVKIWINVYWNANGAVEYIVFYPKGNSKFIDYEKFRSFLHEFSMEFVMPVQSEERYCFFGSASFPIFIFEDKLSKNGD